MDIQKKINKNIYYYFILLNKIIIQYDIEIHYVIIVNNMHDI